MQVKTLFITPVTSLQNTMSHWVPGGHHEAKASLQCWPQIRKDVLELLLAELPHKHVLKMIADQAGAEEHRMSRETSQATEQTYTVLHDRL